MRFSTTRRDMVLGLTSLLASGSMPALAAEASPMAEIERRHGGRLGFFALDTGSGRRLAYREDERFLMCSTFKGLLAAQVLARVDAGQERLDRSVSYGEKDMVFTSPVTEANLGKGALPVETLCRAVLEVSDNTAAILLMRDSGGPAGLTKFLRDLGDTITRSDRYEPDSNRSSGVLDTTTPRAITQSAGKILLGNILSPASLDRLEAGMAACQPGANRLRAALPPDWRAGDRPGTSVEAETNDYAIAHPPGRAPLLVAAYYDAPALDLASREAVLREAGTAFVHWAGG